LTVIISTLYSRDDPIMSRCKMRIFLTTENIRSKEKVVCCSAISGKSCRGTRQMPYVELHHRHLFHLGN
jgi:hypothetical protein